MSRVLCIEDENEMSLLVEMILSRHGHEVARAATSEAALALLDDFSPEVILLDLMLPDVDGWDIYQYLKSQDTTRHIPVIVVTARAQNSEKMVALRVNQVDDYVTKPFEPAQLVESVARALEKSAHLR